MYEILLCYRRRRGMRRAAFNDLWRDGRKALVRRLHGQLAFADYGQLRRASRLNPLYIGTRLSRAWPMAALFSLLRGLKIPSPFPEYGGADERWDVVESFAYPSLEAAAEALASPGGQEALTALRDDAAPSVRNGAAVLAARVVVKADETLGRPRVVTLFHLRARRGMTREEMLAHWGGPHRALVDSLSSSLGYRQYDQLHARRHDENSPLLSAFGGRQKAPYDGVARLTYAKQWHLLLRLLDPRLQIANLRLIRDEVGFIDLGSSILVFGEEDGL